jgi:hypothetical protein
MLQERLEDIAALKLRYTRGMCRQAYKREQDAVQAQLRRIELVHGEEFIVNDFTEWCGSDEAARSSSPFDMYFRGFDDRMRGLTEPLRQPDRPDSQLEKAGEWLVKALTDGPKSSQWLTEHAREEAGICPLTLRRAKQYLHVKAEKCGPEWIWDLPNDVRDGVCDATSVQR